MLLWWRDSTTCMDDEIGGQNADDVLVEDASASGGCIGTTLLPLRKVRNDGRQDGAGASGTA